jgi:hypothetical protein
MNWRAKPLTSLLVIISLIGATTTTTGLRVTAKLDEKNIPARYKSNRTREGKTKYCIVRNNFHGEWNYVIAPNL